MRPILALALVCLALTLALNQARTLFSGDAAGGAGELADRALDIELGARGALLAAAEPGGERIGDGIRLGERTLPAAGRIGLHAAFLGRALELLDERVYDVAHARADARALLAALEAAEAGEVLVLASSGRLEPVDGVEAAPELAQALVRLGARARPGAATPESWALIAVRLERGWVPLAEAYSRDSGVALAFTLAPDLERYADFRGDFAEVRAPERREIYLEEELQHAHLRSSGVEPALGRRVLGRPLEGILLAPRRAGDGGLEPARLSWSDVTLGPGSGLVTWIGLADGAAAGSDGVRFEVRVDGQNVYEQLVLPGAPWRVVLVDLRPFAGRSVELELRVDPLQSETGDAALFGRPVLVHGYDRSPLEVLAQER